LILKLVRTQNQPRKSSIANAVFSVSVAMQLKRLFARIVIYQLNLNKMKEIDFLKADKQIRNLHKSEFSDSMIRDFNTEYFYMYTIGYNDAVKKHNAKREKKNNSRGTINGTVKPGECDASAQKRNNTMRLAFEMFKTAIDGLTEIREKFEEGMKK
jgi:hypothetical protein